MDWKEHPFKVGLVIVMMLIGITYAVSLKLAPPAITEQNFIGKWHSSRLASPIYLEANGEWRIKTDDGKVLQYGIWRYQDNKIIWSVQLHGQAMHDPNPVISTGSDQFKLKEANGDITTFDKIR